MQPIDFIAQHLNINNLSKPVHKCNNVCAFTGNKITEGVKLKDITAGTFTDYEYIRYNSEYASVNTALCISQSILNDTPSYTDRERIEIDESAVKFEFKEYKKFKQKINSLRSYSFICTNDDLLLLSREDFMRNILNPPEPPFIIAYSFNNKKHISYKSVISYSKEEFFVCTDSLGNVKFEAEKVNFIYPIIQRWYTKNNEIHKVNESYFNKTEILSGSENYGKIKTYGIDLYEKENAIIEKYRNTSFLTIMVRLLNLKEVNSND